MKRLTLLILLTIVLGFTSLKITAETIELYVEDAYAPFSQADGSGISNKIVTQAFLAMGVKVELKVLPFARLAMWLENGRGLGGFNAVITEDTVDKFIFGKEPIYVAKTYYYYHKDRPVLINKDSDLNNEKLQVGIVNGYMYHDELFKRPFQRHLAQSDERLIRMLMLGRIDLAHMTGKTVDYHLKKMNIDSSELVRIEHVRVVEAPLYVAFNKQHSKANYYSKLLDSGIQKLKAQGRYKALTEL